eukprot:7437327-Pyramimonas_sp.AAC.1
MDPVAYRVVLCTQRLSNTGVLCESRSRREWSAVRYFELDLATELVEYRVCLVHKAMDLLGVVLDTEIVEQKGIVQSGFKLGIGRAPDASRVECRARTL